LRVWNKNKKTNFLFLVLLLSTLFSKSKSFIILPSQSPLILRPSSAVAIKKTKTIGLKLRSTTTTTLKSNTDDEYTSSSSSSSSSLENGTSDNRYHADLLHLLKRREDVVYPTKDVLQRRAQPLYLRGDIDGAEKAIIMLRRMIDIGVAIPESFEVVFKAILKRGRMQWIDPSGFATCTANELEYLLVEFESMVDNSSNEVVSMDIYNMVLEAYANCANARSNFRYAERAECLYQRITNTNDSSNMEADDVDDESVSGIFQVLRAWAWQQGNRDNSKCADKANGYLRLLQRRHKHNNINNNNNRKHAETTLSFYAQGCDAVLEAYSKAIGGATSADTIYKERLKLTSAANDDNSDDITSPTVPMEDYTNIILAWAKDSTSNGISDNRVESAEKAMDYLEMMSEMFVNGIITGDPEHIAYNSVIAAWNKANQPHRAEQVLWLMETKVRKEGAVQSLEPDVATYNSVLDAFVKDNSKITTDTLTAVKRIIQYMEDNHSEQPKIRPDSYTYNVLLKAWNFSGNLKSIDEMMLILDKMEQIVIESDKGISNKNFNVIMNTYAKKQQNDPLAYQKVLQLLDRMKASRFVEPDSITYSTAIECLTKINSLHYQGDPNFAADKALELLSDLKSMYQTTKKDSVMPNSRTFAMAISALTRSKKKDKAQLARSLLDELIEFYDLTKDIKLRPTVHPYNYVLSCASKSFDADNDIKMEAFKIAAKTYQELREHKVLKPDSFTYNYWFQTCDTLLQPTSDLYDKFMRLSFKQCIKEGLLSKQVLYKIQRCNLTWKQKGDLLECDPQNVRDVVHDDLPPSWSRNIR